MPKVSAKAIEFFMLQKEAAPLIINQVPQTIKYSIGMEHLLAKVIVINNYNSVGYLVFFSIIIVIKTCFEFVDRKWFVEIKPLNDTT